MTAFSAGARRRRPGLVRVPLWVPGLALLGMLAAPAAAAPLWAVTAPGAPGTVLLMGSMHMLRPDHYPLPDRVDAAYRRADRLVMELRPEDLQPSASRAAMARVGISAPGRTVDDLLVGKERERARGLARAAGLRLEPLAGMEPWFAALTLYAGALTASGYDPALGLDRQLGERAARDGKPVQALETLDAQLQLFKRLPLDIQRKMLLKTLEELPDSSAETDALAASWRAGDADALARRLETDFEGYAGLRARLVEDRNRAWLADIEALLRREGTTLVVVGALHLAGPEGLPELLAGRGHRVSRVSGAAGR